MKLNRCFGLMIIAFLSFGTTFAEENVLFFNGTVHAAKEKAKKENKLYFIEFYAKWCEPCKWMDEHTFTHPALTHYVSKNYVPVKVDVENLDGYVWKQKYKVQYLPTIIVLNADGIVLGKYEKSMGANDLLKLLQHHRGAPVSAETEMIAQEKKASATPVITNPSPEAKPVFVTIKREPGMPTSKDVVKKTSASVSATSTVSTSPAPTTPVNTAPVKKAKANPVSDGNEFRIQTGIYSDPVNATNEVSKLKKQFTNNTVQIFSKKNVETNTVTYRVTVGKFASRQEAASFAQTMKSQGVSGVVKHASELK